METGNQIEEKINSKGGRENNNMFKGIDSIFKLAFRTREIWELINEFFIMWENIGIKN